MVRVFVVFSLAGVVACAEPAPAPGGLSPDAEQAFIYGGSLPNYGFHDSTVALFEVRGADIDPYSYCSGSLIAPDVVMTAAHCLDKASYGAADWELMDPKDLVVFVGDNAGVRVYQHLYAVAQTGIHPSHERFSLSHDIGLARLTHSVTEVQPTPHLPKSLALTPDDIGRTMNYAGFGETEFGGYDVKLQVNIPLAGFGCVVPGCPGVGSPSTSFSYSMVGGVGPCFGDSGGPTYFPRGGAPYVAGITSYGDANCAEYGVQTRVDAYAGGITKFIDQQAPQPDAAGYGSCGDGTCNQGESCDGRGSTVACGDCPGVVQGNPANQYCHMGSACIGGGCAP